ncbi:MAG TPA: ATP-binding cassette domain-containing protein [Bacteroidales bacterium]|nr:ATP-binding cassette domain-containing protein [Bacteroidales bacterium]
MNELLRLTDVSASYSGETVLDNVNLSIREGDFIGVIGPNGGGKTTLLLIILGLLKPVGGRIDYWNQKVTPHNIGYLPQMSESDITFPLSVLDVVLSGLMHKKKAYGRMTGTDKVKANRVLDDLGILNLRTRILSELSGGELQRVYLARALVGSPALLLLDEPGNFVDSSFEQGFYDKLMDLNNSMTIMMVSHDVGTISAYVKSFACVNRCLHYHDSGKITTEQLKGYGCPIQLIAHGDIPHTVLEKH